MVAGNATIEKPREQWDEEERKMTMATKSNSNCRIKRKMITLTIKYSDNPHH